MKPNKSGQSKPNDTPKPTSQSTNQLFESIPNEHGPDKLILNTNDTLEMLEQIPSKVVQDQLDDGKEKTLRCNLFTCVHKCCVQSIFSTSRC